MAGVNKVILIGNLGKDPEVKYFEGGSVNAKFSLATSDSYKKDGNKVEQTEWHNIILWGKQAEFAEKYLKKGMTIYVEGKLRTRSWEDKENTKRYTTEIFADQVTILSKKNEENASNTEYTRNVENSVSAEEATDDLPF